MILNLMLSIITACLLFIAGTMLARANDLRWKPGWHWKVRQVGFTLSGATPVGIIYYGWMHEWIIALMFATAFCVGLVCVFFTTPYQKPWWIYMSKGNEP